MKRATRRLGKLVFCVGLLLAWALVLSGCGGGSSTTTASTSAPGTSPSTTPPSTSQPGTSGSGSGSAGSSSSGSGSGSSGSSGSGGSGGSSGSSGGSGSATTAALAYVAGGNNNFYGIRVDSSSNISTVSGSPYSPGGSFAVSGNLLYVFSATANSSSGVITSFRADSNGVLSQIGNTPINSEGGGMITIDSTGKFLYASANAAPGPSGSQNAVYGFSIDQNSGALTQLSGSPWYLTGGMGPASEPRVSPNGSWLCVDMELARTNEGVQCYARKSDGSIDGSSDVQPAVSNTSICGLTITADSTHVIYTDCAQSVFSSIIENTQNGTSASAGTGAGEVDLDPTGHWLVLANSTSVSIFSVATDDSLALVGAPITTPARPDHVAFSRSGTYVFVSSDSGTEVFSFNPSTGALTPLNASSLSPGTSGPVATM